MPSDLEEEKDPKKLINEFIDDEAELSGDDVGSDDDLESSDDDRVDTELVDLEAKDLSSEEEEEVRRLYHKQLATEDRRAVLLLQERLEENDIEIGQRRRRRFKWQDKELMENSLARHYNPDDEDSLDDEEDDDFDEPFTECAPRLKRPTAESILMSKTTRVTTSFDTDDESNSQSNKLRETILSDDSNSQLPIAMPSTSRGVDLNRFLIRDKELVQALSTRQVIVESREEKDRVIQRELKRVAESKSIFDSLY